MEKQIDKLILKHENDKTTTKYIVTCSIDEFQNLQKLLSEKYKIKDYNGANSMWRHMIETDYSWREGTVKFKGFNLNVFASTKIIAGYTISKMNGLPLIYMDIFKNDK